MSNIIKLDNDEQWLAGAAGALPINDDLITLLKKAAATPASGSDSQLDLGVSDDRLRITATTAPPAALVCAIEMGMAPDHYSHVGTGWLAGPRTIITAGHVIWDKDQPTPFTHFRILPGRNEDCHPFGAQLSQNARCAPGFDPTDATTRRLDYGAIQLPAPFANLGHFPMLATPPNNLPGRTASLMGYPLGAHNQVLNGRQMWWHADLISQDTVTINDGRIHYRTDTSRGQSGAPVILWRDTGFPTAPDAAVIGIHAHGYGELKNNKGVHITPAVLEQIMRWVEQDDAP
jgi:glutamyl endopeptidase